MEKRLTIKCNGYLKQFKINIKNYIDEHVSIKEQDYN